MQIPIPLIWNQESLAGYHMFASILGWLIAAVGLVYAALVGLQSSVPHSKDDRWHVKTSVAVILVGLEIVVTGLYTFAVVALAVAAGLLLGLGRSVLILLNISRQ